MRFLFCTLFTFLLAFLAAAQTPADKIYETERAFEKMAAEKGVRAAFLEYLTPDAVMFMPDAVNAREAWNKRQPSPAALTWSPILIDVAANGIYAYSIGESVFKPKGRDDRTEYAGHYLSIWRRGDNGDYRAVLDIGIAHPAPAAYAIKWKDMTTGVKNEKAISVIENAAGFFSLAESSGAVKAYKTYLADDAIVMRDGAQPYVGRSAAVSGLGKVNGAIKFAKKQSLSESDDFAYHYSKYSITDKAGKETERGNYVQVWKLRGGNWKIVADVFVPLPADTK